MCGSTRSRAAPSCTICMPRPCAARATSVGVRIASSTCNGCSSTRRRGSRSCASRCRRRQTRCSSARAATSSPTSSCFSTRNAPAPPQRNAVGLEVAFGRSYGGDDDAERAAGAVPNRSRSTSAAASSSASPGASTASIKSARRRSRSSTTRRAATGRRRGRPGCSKAARGYSTPSTDWQRWNCSSASTRNRWCPQASTTSPAQKGGKERRVIDAPSKGAIAKVLADLRADDRIGRVHPHGDPEESANSATSREHAAHPSRSHWSRRNSQDKKLAPRVRLAEHE